MRLIWLLLASCLATLPTAAKSAEGYNPHCLTKEQARAKYPGQVIYWRTANRCWGDVKPGHAVNRTLKGGRQDTPIDASENATTRRVEKPIAQERPSIP
jgi:hypothetical protein